MKYVYDHHTNEIYVTFEGVIWRVAILSLRKRTWNTAKSSINTIHKKKSKKYFIRFLIPIVNWMKNTQKKKSKHCKLVLYNCGSSRALFTSIETIFCIKYAIQYN